jgi:hypothetical protein
MLIWLVLATTLALQPAVAQPLAASPNNGPFRTTSDGADNKLMLNLQRAHHHWNDEVAGSNALFTRYKRLVFRLPHYKTDAALKEEWNAKLAAKTLPVMPGAPQVVPQN